MLYGSGCPPNTLTTFKGCRMNLNEIQSAAEFVYDKHETGTMGLDYDVYVLAGLIANLAAQMKELEPVGVPKYIRGADYGSMKQHFITVQYRSTVDVNDEIMDAIKLALPWPNDSENLDYIRIVSDK